MTFRSCQTSQACVQLARLDYPDMFTVENTVTAIAIRALGIAHLGTGAISPLLTFGDYTRTAWMVLKDSLGQTFITRWTNTLSLCYGYQNMTFARPGAQYSFDVGTSRLYLTYPTYIQFIQLNPNTSTPASFFLGTVQDYFRVNETVYPVLTATINQDVGSSMVPTMEILGFGTGSPGYPWLVVQYGSAVTNTTLGGWFHLPTSFGVGQALPLGNASVFGYPYSMGSLTPASSAWGTMAIVSSGQVMTRDCQMSLDACVQTECTIVQGTCTYGECRCRTGVFTGLYAPSQCVDVNECLVTQNTLDCQAGTNCINTFGGYGCYYAGSIIPTWRSLLSATNPTTFAASGSVGFYHGAMITSNTTNAGTQMIIASFGGVESQNANNYPLLQSQVNSSDPNLDRNVATKIVTTNTMKPSVLFAITLLSYSFAYNSSDFIYIQSALGGPGTGPFPLIEYYQISTQTTIFVRSNQDIITTAGFCVDTTTQFDSMAIVFTNQIANGNVLAIFQIVAVIGSFQGVVMTEWDAHFTRVFSCYPFSGLNTVAPSCVSGNNADNIQYYQCGQQTVSGLWGTVPNSDSIAGSQTIYANATGHLISDPFLTANNLGIPSSDDTAFITTFTVLTDGTLASGYAGSLPDRINVFRNILILDPLTGNLTREIPIVTVPFFDSYTSGYRYLINAVVDRTGLLVTTPNQMPVSLGTDLGGDRIPFPFANLAAMHIVSSIEGSPCNSSNNGGCGVRYCVETISANTVCDLCSQFQPLIDNALAPLLAVLSAFTPDMLYSDPYFPQPMYRQLWVASDTINNTLFILNLDTQTLVSNISLPTISWPIYGVSMSFQSHLYSLFAVTRRFLTNQPSTTWLVQTNFVTGQNILYSNVSDLVQAIPILTDTAYDVTGFTIDNVGIVWVLFQSDSISVLSKWHPGNLTVLGWANVTLQLPTGPGSRALTRFAYDFHRIFWVVNHTSPVMTYLTGGVDYVEQFLGDVLYTVYDTYRINSPNNGTILAMDVSPFGFTVVVVPGLVQIKDGYSVTGFNVVTYDNNFDEIQTLPLLLSSNSFTGFESSEVPSQIYLSAFGDVFITMTPSNTLLRMPCVGSLTLI